MDWNERAANSLMATQVFYELGDFGNVVLCNVLGNYDYPKTIRVASWPMLWSVAVIAALWSALSNTDDVDPRDARWYRYHRYDLWLIQRDGFSRTVFD